MTKGLVGGEGFAIDTSVVKTDASRQRHREDDDDQGGDRAVREYLESLDEDGSQANKPGLKVSPTDPAAGYTAAPGGRHSMPTGPTTSLIPTIGSLSTSSHGVTAPA